MNEGAPTISEILQLRAWKHALFTTYTLSLSYFESEILRPLLRAGCSDIWLIADAEGYRSSLLERRSMRVGQEYRLVPAALPRGVFHAKCIYLGSDEGDLLLVGSGNVTFGGHGKNAEVFEVLSPDNAASAFADFADFLESVGGRPDLAIANTDWLDHFAERARIARRRGSDQDGAPPVRLLHPVLRPVVDELPELLAPHGICRKAVVMSPYHDHDGFAVRQLSERLGNPSMSVAVTEPGRSPFPFQDAAAWPNPALPVSAAVQETRFVHAKWYEFLTASRRVLLTGSINATRKALTTTDNVELGVVRVLSPQSSSLGWQPEERPMFAPQNRVPSGLGGNEIVYASFSRHESSELRGRLITLNPPEGNWSGRLIQADGDAASFEVRIQDTGKFVLRLPEFERFSDMPALQIVLTLGEREARGWVHNEMLLSVSGRRRLSAGALGRLIRGEDSDDDIEALLDYLSMQADRHLRIFDRPVQNASDDSGGPQTASQLVTVSISDLAPVSGDRQPESASGHDARSHPDPFDTAMLRLRRMLLGHGRTRGMPLQGEAEFALGEDDDPGTAATNKKPQDPARKLGLTEFERAVGKLIDDAGDKPEVLSGLLALSLEVGMWFRLYRLDDKDAAHEFLAAWFHRACKLADPAPEPKSSLQQHILTAAATVMCLAERSDQASVAAAELHDSLERYFGGPVDPVVALRSLLPVHAGFAEVLLGAEELDLRASLSAILRQRTVRQQLVDALALAARSEPIPPHWDVFRLPAGADLLAALQSPTWHKKVKAAYPGCSACAFDYYAFGRDDAATFEQTRIGRCIHCKRFTLKVTP